MLDLLIHVWGLLAIIDVAGTLTSMFMRCETFN